MKQKKTICLALSALMCLSIFSMLAACGEKEDSLSVTYPTGEGLSKKAVRVYNKGNPSKWNMECSHDPVVVEENGTYYSFGTDNFGPFGYQIRKSTDLMNWEYVGVAIPEFGQGGSVLEKGREGTSPLQEVYDILAEDAKFDCTTLWAPEVYPASDGGWWLYGSWTTTFGSSRSVIFQCHADNVAGPYTYTDTLVVSGKIGPNAIDASIFEDAEGKLWMSYGSFYSDKFNVLELDKETGLRKDGYTYDDFLAGTINASAYRGAKLVDIKSSEGSVVTYHTDVPVYGGDITQGYDETLWKTENNYYLMCSNQALDRTYNMRTFKSSNPTRGYKSLDGSNGNKISGSFSWRYDKDDSSIGYDYFCPGHNDMFRTKEGVNCIAYHNRSQFGNNNHYLFISMYDFNANGDLVVSPNRYVGESVRTIDAREIYQSSNGKWDMVAIPYSPANKGTDEKNYASQVVFKEDGTISGSATGTWQVYGDHYIYLVVNGTKYYGSIMPAYIEKCARGGLTISALDVNGTAIYFNMHFDAE
ncbi:MAG: glycoside hydrolase family 43 protein [Clostridia bacterium]|nr:glycoside hydrolase family 43 protein [Clostridia bacterium]